MFRDKTRLGNYVAMKYSLSASKFVSRFVPICASNLLYASIVAFRCPFIVVVDARIGYPKVQWRVHGLSGRQ